jgi:N6-L-threonylcarbamoyladenine synthase
MKILGIETSCDETAAGVVEDGKRLLSNVVSSSVDLHTAYGGVVPEIASRSHLEVILPTINAALAAAETDWDDIDAIAVTQGPGLSGSLLIGVLTARTLAIAKDKPLFPVNHVEAHVYGNFITKSAVAGYVLPASPPQFPLLALIVSGGHSQLVLFKNHFDYRLLGQTRDDAVGEAFDKVAKILGLPYPGGPSVAKAAETGDSAAFKLPVSRLENPYDFSFSGLKTAVLRLAQTAAGKKYDFPSVELSKVLNRQQKADIAASFQRTAAITLVNSLKKAAEEYKPASIVVAGGVAANLELRRQLVDAFPTPVLSPDIKLCTDNGAMIAVSGYFKSLNQQSANPYELEVLPNFPM